MLALIQLALPFAGVDAAPLDTNSNANANANANGNANANANTNANANASAPNKSDYAKSKLSSNFLAQTGKYKAPDEARLDRTATATPQKAKPVILKGDVSTFGVLTDEVQERLGITSTKQGNSAKITKVRPNSEAHRGGLRSGDLITDARYDNGAYVLSAQRDGQNYQLVVGAQQNNYGGYRLQTPQSAPSAPPSFQAKIDQFAGRALDSRELQTLGAYNFELIIDRSMSMRKRDCPGGLSRWQWCGMQASDIVRSLSPFSPRGSTITRFAGEFDVHENVDPASAAELLSRNDFQLGTRLAEPLAARLDKHFRMRRPGDKPLLLAIITDGCPAPRPEPRMVVETLVAASQYLQSPNEVTIVFLQVGGDDYRGQSYLMNLSTNLRRYGAKYQYVRTMMFDQLVHQGLARSLVQAITTQPAASFQPRSGPRNIQEF